MANLDDVAKTIWNTKKPALGLLAATGAQRAACLALEPEERAPFEALSGTLLGWWPKQKASPTELYEGSFPACQAMREQVGDRARLAMDAAYLQMAALLKLDPRSLPADGPYNLREDDFVALVRRLAKANHTDLELWKGRFAGLLEASDQPWEALIARADRMGFGRNVPKLRDLPAPLNDLARTVDLGAVTSWSQMGPKHALRLELGSTKRIAMLDDEQKAALIAALPWIA